MVWYDLLKSLRDYLVNLPTAQSEGVMIKRPARYIKVGALNPNDFDLSADENGMTGAIFLIRDRELNEKIYNGGDGIAVFYVENWIRCEDSDMINCYKELSDQEDAFCAALVEWFCKQQTNENNVGADLINLKIDKVIKDVDSVLPTQGSRTKIHVTWSKRTI